MSSIPILEVVSFSTEHSTHRITNLIKGIGKWTIPIKNVSAIRGQEITDLEAEFRLPPCQIEALDIGNFWTAILEIEVGRSGESDSQRKPLLMKDSNIFMNKLDCRRNNNFEMVKFFQKSDINSEVLNSSKPWDRLRVVCKQPHRNDVLFGLSLLKIRGQRLDHNSQIFPHPNLENILLTGKNTLELEIDKNQDKVLPKDSSNSDHPEWCVPGSRASKILEKSTSNKSKIGLKFNFKNKQQQQKENTSGIFKKTSTITMLKRKLRDEDDLNHIQEPLAKRISKPTTRNDIVSQDNTRSLTQKKNEVKSNPKIFAGTMQKTKNLADRVNKLLKDYDHLIKESEIDQNSKDNEDEIEVIIPPPKPPPPIIDLSAEENDGRENEINQKKITARSKTRSYSRSRSRSVSSSSSFVSDTVRYVSDDGHRSRSRSRSRSSSRSFSSSSSVSLVRYIPDEGHGSRSRSRSHSRSRSRSFSSSSSVSLVRYVSDDGHGSRSRSHSRTHSRSSSRSSLSSTIFYVPISTRSGSPSPVRYVPASPSSKKSEDDEIEVIIPPPKPPPPIIDLFDEENDESEKVNEEQPPSRSRSRSKSSGARETNDSKVCKRCSKSFSFKKDLENHRKKCQLRCKHCFESFSHKKYLKKHKKICNNELLKINLDEELLKNRRNNSDHLEGFDLGSQASKLLEKSTTKNKSNLKTIQQEQKENTSEIFDENSAISPLQRKLRDEDDLNHVEEPPAKKISKFFQDFEIQCKHCQKTFDNEEILGAHLPFCPNNIFCIYCLKNFKGWGNLRAHIGKFHKEIIEKPPKLKKCKVQIRDLKTHSKWGPKIEELLGNQDSDADIVIQGEAADMSEQMINFILDQLIGDIVQCCEDDHPCSDGFTEKSNNMGEENGFTKALKENTEQQLELERDNFETRTSPTKRQNLN